MNESNYLTIEPQTRIDLKALFRTPIVAEIEKLATHWYGAKTYAELVERIEAVIKKLYTGDGWLRLQAPDLDTLGLLAGTASAIKVLELLQQSLGEHEGLEATRRLIKFLGLLCGKETLSDKARKAAAKYGRYTCIRAFQSSKRGNGASSIGIELGLKTNQADAAINAGREIIAGK